MNPAISNNLTTNPKLITFSRTRSTEPSLSLSLSPTVICEKEKRRSARAHQSLCSETLVYNGEGFHKTRGLRISNLSPVDYGVWRHCEIWSGHEAEILRRPLTQFDGAKLRRRQHRQNVRPRSWKGILRKRSARRLALWHPMFWQNCDLLFFLLL